MKMVCMLMLLVFGLSLWSPRGVKAQQIIAHRGASYLAPENTLPAVKLGYELGADAVEVDIHLSKDKRIMVNHDEDTQRTAGGENFLIQRTASEYLRQLDVGSWKDEKYKGTQMPFLEEVLELVPAGKKLVVEIKSSAAILPYLQALIEEKKMQEQLILISFDKEVIIKAKESMPRIPAYWLLHSFEEYAAEEAIAIAREAGLAGLDVNYRLIDAEFMEKMQQAGLEVLVYTVNEARVASALQSLGVKGITTDRPQWLRQQMARLAE